MVKELLDNALDYLESTHTQQQQEEEEEEQPQIHVIVEKYQQKNIRITVSNSNYARNNDNDDKSNAVFSKQTLRNIFDFNKYHSSKRNQYRITKGALGDALKEVLCVPHVLAYDRGIADWNYPLYVISQQKLFQIKLIIDRINQTIHSKIDESDFDFDLFKYEYKHRNSTDTALPS